MAALYSWQPDTCPASPPCEFDIATGKAIRLCATHQKRRTNGDSDKTIFDAVVSKNKEKNTLVNVQATLLGASSGRVLWSIDDKEAITVLGLKDVLS